MLVVKSREDRHVGLAIHGGGDLSFGPGQISTQKLRADKNRGLRVGPVEVDVQEGRNTAAFLADGGQPINRFSNDRDLGFRFGFEYSSRRLKLFDLRKGIHVVGRLFPESVEQHRGGLRCF
ncbi:MAG: hypothetical protein ACJ8F7_08370 [Gemmataceae bacterium]